MEPDGSMVRHADLSGISSFGWNEIVVDGRGNIYLNSINFGFLEGSQPKSGIIALVTPDGKARKVAGDLAFPNGMVITPDNSTLIVSESFTGRLIAFDIEATGHLANRRVWAEGLGPDGICMDAEGAIWVQTGDTRTHSGRDDAPEGAVVRVREGGEVCERIEYDRAIFAVMLGGPQDAVPPGGPVARPRAAERGGRSSDRAGAGQPGIDTRCRMAVTRARSHPARQGHSPSMCTGAAECPANRFTTKLVCSSQSMPIYRMVMKETR